MKSSLTFAAMLLATAVQGAENRDLLVSTSWLQQHLLDRNVIVVEIGERAAYEKEHIARARFIALSDLVTDVDGTPNELPATAEIERVFRTAGVGDRTRIILYSREPIPAARAFFTLDHAGHGHRAALLDGGFAKWAAEGHLLESGPPAAVDPGDFEVRQRPEAIVRIATLKTLVNCADWLGSNFALIDVRSRDQFEDGHINCAMNIPWQENLNAESTPTFKSPAELKTLYAGRGITPDASVVTYCRSGMQASVTYFALRYLGYDVHLYDGSFSEWSSSRESNRD